METSLSKEYPNLAMLLGLHQRLEILYVVTGFEAAISNEDGYPRLIFEGSGETIEGALAALEAVLSQLPAGFSMSRGGV